MSVGKSHTTKGVLTLTKASHITVGEGNSTPLPVLNSIWKLMERKEELQTLHAHRVDELILLEELKRERDPKSYDANIWFRYPKKTDGI